MCSHLPPTREQLLPAAHQGDASALGALLESYRPLLLLLAREGLSPALETKASASDIVQDTFVDAFRSFGCFQGTSLGEFQHWLGQIFRHTLTDVARRYLTTAKRDLRSECSLDNPSTMLAEQLGSRHEDPARTALSHEACEALERALHRLSLDDRLLIELRHRHRLPFDRIAGRLGCTEVAVRRRWLRAVERWRQEVVACYGPL